MDDPAAGRIPKPDMPGYMDSFKGAIKEMRSGDDSSPFIELSEKVVRDDADTMTAMDLLEGARHADGRRRMDQGRWRRRAIGTLDLLHETGGITLRRNAKPN